MFADMSCPFVYVGLRRLLEARDTRGSNARIRVRAWPLEWINGRQLAPQLVAAEIAKIREKVAPHLFAGFEPSRFPDSTIDALGLAAAAYGRDVQTGEQVSLRVREALFEEGGISPTTRSCARSGAGSASSRCPGPWPPTSSAPIGSADRLEVCAVHPTSSSGTRSWFCPALRIRHEGSDFDISVDSSSLDDFYAAALG